MRHAVDTALVLFGIASVVATGALRTPLAAQGRGTERPAVPKVRLVVGLVTVSAVHEPDKGDYESILKVDDVSADLVGYTLSANVEDRRVTVRRKVRTQDMAHAHGWRPRYNEGDPGDLSGYDRKHPLGRRAQRSEDQGADVARGVDGRRRSGGRDAQGSVRRRRRRPRQSPWWQGPFGQGRKHAQTRRAAAGPDVDDRQRQPRRSAGGARARNAGRPAVRRCTCWTIRRCRSCCGGASARPPSG